MHENRTRAALTVALLSMSMGACGTLRDPPPPPPPCPSCPPVRPALTPPGECLTGPGERLAFVMPALPPTIEANPPTPESLTRRAERAELAVDALATHLRRDQVEDQDRDAVWARCAGYLERQMQADAIRQTADEES